MFRTYGKDDRRSGEFTWAQLVTGRPITCTALEHQRGHIVLTAVQHLMINAFIDNDAPGGRTACRPRCCRNSPGLRSAHTPLRQPRQHAPLRRQLHRPRWNERVPCSHRLPLLQPPRRGWPGHAGTAAAEARHPRVRTVVESSRTAGRESPIAGACMREGHDELNKAAANACGIDPKLFNVHSVRR